MLKTDSSGRPLKQIVDEVIDTIILGRFPGLRIAAHHRRTMNSNRQLRLQLSDFHLGEIFCFFVVITKAGVML